MPHKKLFSEQKGNHRRYGQKSHDRLSLDFNSATPVSKTWKNLVDEIETGKYREFINRVLGTDKFHFKYHWHYTESAASVSPHCDVEWKLGSHIFYFNSHQDWDPIWGGQTVILDDNGEKILEYQILMTSAVKLKFHVLVITVYYLNEPITRGMA